MNDLYRSDRPKVTVLMSCYNGSQWIAEAIESVLNQSYENFEFLIVDDGSTDGSNQIIEAFKKNDRRIIHISKANTGLADSLNIGIKRASGSWIARLDVDDICNSQRLKVQVEASLQSDDIVYIGSNFEEVDELGQLLSIQTYPVEHASLVKNLINSHRFPPHSSAFYKTSTVKLLGGYRAKISRAEDYDLWLRLSGSGQFISIPQPLVKIRKHANQISNENLGRQQFLDSKMALMSYYLVQMGCFDPINLDDPSFNNLIAWVRRAPVFKSALSAHDFSITFKNLFKKNKNLDLFLYLLSNLNLLSTFIIRRFYGDPTSRSLAMQLKGLDIKTVFKDFA